MVQFLSINFFFVDFFNFCWVFQKFPFFYVTLYYRCAYGYIESFLSHDPVSSGPVSSVLWQTCPVQCMTNMFPSWVFNTFWYEAFSLWNSKISTKSYQNCNRRFRILSSGFKCFEAKSVWVVKVIANTYCNVRWTFYIHITRYMWGGGGR